MTTSKSKYTKCIKCGLPNTYSGIQIGMDGICQYCNFYDVNREVFENKEQLHNKFMEKISKAKSQAIENGSKYDCLVGFSGGKDSTFVIERMKNVYGMRVLAFTYDNGFSTEYGMNSIRNGLEKLDVDHINFKLKSSELKQLNSRIVSTMNNFCIVCFHMMHYYSHLIAIEKKIPLILNGRTKGQVLQAADNKKNLEPFEKIQNLRQFEYQMLSTVDQSLLKIIETSGIDFLDDGKVESLSYFMYHDYDEDHIKNHLVETIGWERPIGEARHPDCWAHCVAEKKSLESRGYPIMTGELAVMVRQGKVSVEEAANRIRRDTVDYSQVDQSIMQRFDDYLRGTAVEK